MNYNYNMILNAEENKELQKILTYVSDGSDDDEYADGLYENVSVRVNSILNRITSSNNMFTYNLVDDDKDMIKWAISLIIDYDHSNDYEKDVLRSVLDKLNSINIHIKRYIAYNIIFDIDDDDLLDEIENLMPDCTDILEKIVGNTMSNIPDNKKAEYVLNYLHEHPEKKIDVFCLENECELPFKFNKVIDANDDMGEILEYLEEQYELAPVVDFAYKETA